MSSPISVLVVEDHGLFRTGIRVSCNRDKNITVTGEASNGSEAVEQVEKLNPDVVLMDVNMPLMDGIESTRLIKNKNQNTKVIMLTSHESQGVLQSAVSAGASGYCLKDVDSEILCSVIKAVHRGEVWIDPTVKKNAEDQVNTLKASGSTRPSESSNVGLFGSAPVNANDLLVNRYENLGLLGQGGMSLVYKARHKMLDKIVAVKVLANHLSHIEAFSARFIQEARVASRLSHPNIASVFDFGITSDSNAFLVMEFADGPSLSHHLGNNGRVDEATAMMIFKQLRDALGYAHEQGVIHRDIKPANTILTNGNGNFPHVKLIDFGLAKLSNIENPKLTINGEVIGSPLYMSPEQCKGMAVDNRSDISSLGCLMHEVITGYPPFRGETALDTFRMHVQDEYEEPSANVCSEHLREILRKCLSKRPEDRFSSLNDIVL